MEHKLGFRRLEPQVMPHSHWHGHTEINYLFNAKKVSVPEGRMLMFWDSSPNLMTAT
ncbi:hypothetical protein [uncultured Shewanella sp.]|uniref:hypothetical protein n=1 Tax=Shewanella atlantica TaxID=271099 RepID=UPI002630DB00|nr:hypothetical protein [uncultured Shewanella sp.]